jgi:hypothetical protein
MQSIQQPGILVCTFFGVFKIICFWQTRWAAVSSSVLTQRIFNLCRRFWHGAKWRLHARWLHFDLRFAFTEYGRSLKFLIPS